MMEVDLDANNNSTDKKVYSLRPRSASKPTEKDDILDEIRKPRGKIQKNSKSKTLPLSKYRRKTANARERSRMREINEAFENLRKSIPLISTKCDNPGEKNTKISTLRLAMKYITVLSSALRESDVDSDKESIFSEYSITTPEYRDSYTPTSTSDNSDLSDPFFVTNLSHETSSHCVSPFSASSSFNLREIATKPRHSSWISSLEKTDYKAIIVPCGELENGKRNNFSNVTESDSTLISKTPPTYQLSRVAALDVEVPEHSSSYSCQLTPIETDLRFASLTPISLQLQSTPVLEDWEDLNFSRVDFDELLST